MSERDFSNIRALGPWVYVRLIDPIIEDEKTTIILAKSPMQLSAQSSGVYREEGTSEQRLAHGRGEVISVGRGYYEQGKLVVPDPLLKKGAIAVFRGYLGGANKPHQWLGQEYCFLHLDSIPLVETEEGMFVALEHGPETVVGVDLGTFPSVTVRQRIEITDTIRVVESVVVKARDDEAR